MSRTLYLVCYDISEKKALRRIHKRVSSFAIGGQKSFYECWMTPTELRDLQTAIRQEMNPDKDRVHFFELDPRIKPQFFGTAHRQSVRPFLIC